MVLIDSFKKILLRFPLLQQLIWYGVVGTCAAIVQITTVILVVETLKLHPLTANIFGFCLSFNVSYYGHRHHTFAGTEVRHREAIPRLFLLASLTFISNEFLYYIFLHFTHLPYFIALVLVILTLASISFIFSRGWVFGKGWLVTKKIFR